MITLIYGDDSKKIEESIIDKIGERKADRIQGSKVTQKELEEIILREALFGEKRVLVIENLYKNPKKKDIFLLLKKEKTAKEVLVVERSKLNKSDIAKLDPVAVYDYLLPQHYFRFLDEFYPKNARNLFLLYQELLKNMTAEQIFYSVVKRIRSLIVMKYEIVRHSEVERLATWQLGKLKRQVSFWEEKHLMSFYRKLFELERGMKSGGLPLSLKKHIDMLIITELN